jgi:ATP-dependent helicase/nuclease subunit B
MPRPEVPAQLLPTSISASALASLVACPYQFYARRVLGLEQPEDVREALEKRDYGELLHGILARFHRRFPDLGGHNDVELQANLLELTERAFAAPVRRNFFEHAWLARWRKRIPAYIAWQREREAQGWHFALAEHPCERALDLADGSRLTLHGRLDRVDHAEVGAGGAERAAVLDYKTQTRQALNKRVADPDDVQLAFYALLLGGDAVQASYVALDEDAVSTVPLDDPAHQARRQAVRLKEIYDELRAGGALPANGSGRACAWCEMAGLCRKPYHDDHEPALP